MFTCLLPQKTKPNKTEIACYILCSFTLSNKCKRKTETPLSIRHCLQRITGQFSLFHCFSCTDIHSHVLTIRGCSMLFRSFACCHRYGVSACTYAQCQPSQLSCCYPTAHIPKSLSPEIQHLDYSAPASILSFVVKGQHGLSLPEAEEWSSSVPD